MINVIISPQTNDKQSFQGNKSLPKIIPKISGSLNLTVNSLVWFKMATKRVFSKTELLVNTVKGCRSTAPAPLQPPQPCLVQPAASEMTQAPHISPMGPRNLGPCPPPKLRWVCTTCLRTLQIRDTWYLSKINTGRLYWNFRFEQIL